MGTPSVSFLQLHSPRPRISASPQGLTAVVRYRVRWDDAFTFVNEILGILDGVPWAWPASPNMLAYNAEIEPDGLRQDPTQGLVANASFGSSPGEFYEFGLITVTFGSQSTLTTLPYTDTTIVPPSMTFDPADPIEMSSYQVTYGTEMIKIPGGALAWSANNADGSGQTIPAGVSAPESGAAYYRIPTFDLNLTMRNCLYVDYSIVRSKIGRVNNAVIFSVCERETLLLNGLMTNRREMSDGISILDVTLQYKWRSIGWNVAIGSDGNFYRYIMKNKAPAAIYTETDIHPMSVISPNIRWKPYDLNGIKGR